MSEVTLQAIQARQTELAAMIAKLTAAAASSSARTIEIEPTEIELEAGEHYAGAVLNADGTIAHHLVLLAAKPTERLTWSAAVAWAHLVDGELPTRQEAALIYANCKPHLDGVWHWTSEEHESSASYAWYCYFSHGYQFHNNKSSAGAARAVRRIAVV